MMKKFLIILIIALVFLGFVWTLVSKSSFFVMSTPLTFAEAEKVDLIGIWVCTDKGNHGKICFKDDHKVLFVHFLLRSYDKSSEVIDDSGDFQDAEVNTHRDGVEISCETEKKHQISFDMEKDSKGILLRYSNIDWPDEDLFFRKMIDAK